jgi:hypothetical protein
LTLARKATKATKTNGRNIRRFRFWLSATTAKGSAVADFPVNIGSGKVVSSLQEHSRLAPPEAKAIRLPRNEAHLRG